MIRMLIDRPRAKRRDIRGFVALMARRHPELRTPVLLEDFLTMACREGIHVRLVALPSKQRARTFSVGRHQFVQINRAMAPEEQALQGMHELCHVWRDRPGSGIYYSDEMTGGERCEFADMFAWFVTSEAARLSFDYR